MSSPVSPTQVLTREFLDIRARILETAAAFDRLARSGENLESDPRWLQIRAALDILQHGSTDLAEKVQLVFSINYDPEWRQKYTLAR